MKKLFQIILIFTLSLALSACGGDKIEKDNMDTPQTDDNISSSKLEQEGTNMVSGTPTYGGSIVVGIPQDLDSLDPHKAVAAGTKEVLFNMFEGLVKADTQGNLIPAVSSDYQISEDGKIYTFTLREGITFHNGNSVTAEDVVYSIKRSAGLLDTTDAEVVLESALSNIKEVNIISNNIIEVVLKVPDIELISYFTLSIIPKDYKEQQKKPIGTGPFQFVSYSPLESLVVKRNESYWNKEKPYLDQVTFKIIANSEAAFLELQSGTIDIFPHLTNDQAQQISSLYKIEEGTMNLIQGLFFQYGKEPFNNNLVRQAINYAIDKQEILDMVADGKGSILGSNMTPAMTPYYKSGLEKMYPYNPKKAKELLVEAGYPNGFSFTIIVPSNYQYHIDTAQVIVDQLSRIGVTASIQKVEWATWLSDIYSNRQFEATIIGLDGKLAPRTVIERFSSMAGNNFQSYYNKEFDSILEKAIASTNEKEKIEYYQQLQTILATDALSVYIQAPPLLVAVNKKLGGYTFYPIYVQDMSTIYYIE